MRRPKLGQNFLQDRNVIQKIATFFNPQKQDIVVEIGPGKGALTRMIAPEVSTLYGVEIDSALIPELQKIPDIKIIHGDILKTDLATLSDGRKLRILGNLPYYISTAILTSLIRQKEVIEDMVLMFQEEVAQRILAPNSDSEYGLLSVVSQYFCEIGKGFKVSKRSFQPMPEIDSRVLHFRFRTDTKAGVDEYINLLQKAFSQRRKKLRNNLMRELNIEPDRLDAIFADLNIPENVRAENLTPKQFEALAIRL
ncbi:MAG TPA: 16S rRNA (adenine(1518)-N(6)/adenine(1519)-N(6))-dimethyltransferase RsmA [Acidobacteriota bacterium]|nr:16S rRNA (adenine(1518)-N(6)/adenine(1519)-N(6))-dimethyltransferase RsmA [Acidobacteriota bacterium]